LISNTLDDNIEQSCSFVTRLELHSRANQCLIGFEVIQRTRGRLTVTHESPPHFAFLVHPIFGWHRVILGVRRFHLPLFLGEDTVGTDGVGVIGDVDLPTNLGTVRGLIIAVPDTGDQLVTHQHRAEALRNRAAHIAVEAGVRTIGLGNALAIVAGRGTLLQQSLPVPVTTGEACTAWTCARLVEMALTQHHLLGQPIGLLGFKGTVGHAVAAWLTDRGHRVWVAVTGASAGVAKELGCSVVTTEALIEGCPLLIGANTTGPILDGRKLVKTQLLIDLALPPTLTRNTRPKHLRVYGGETLRVPGRIRAGFWGHLWLMFAGYGRGCIYACLAEPAVGAALGPEHCQRGRRLTVSDLDKAGRALLELGFHPVLRRR